MPRCSVVAFGVLALTIMTDPCWAQGAGAQGTVSGTVTYRERMALPPDAAIDVRLEDTSLHDLPAKLVGESIFAAEGQQVPISFQVWFTPAEINPSHTYQLRANISVNGTITFTSNTLYPVITQGAPMQANIMLQQVTSTATEKRPGPKLHGTYWRLIELNGRPAVPGMGRTQPYIRLHREQGTIEGSSGCSGVVGTYMVDQGALQFSPSGTTLMMCPPALTAQEQGLIAALKATSSYEIEGEFLSLSNGKEVVARFQTAPKD